MTDPKLSDDQFAIIAQAQSQKGEDMPQKSISEIIETIEECQEKAKTQHAELVLEQLLPAVHELALHVQILEQE